MFKDFFNSSEPNHSMTRLLSFILVITAIILTGIITYIGLTSHMQIIDNAGVKMVIPPDVTIINALNYLVIALLGFGLGAKVSQKFGETQFDPNVTNGKENGGGWKDKVTEMISPKKEEVQETKLETKKD